jgi:hypothetical protein
MPSGVQIAFTLNPREFLRGLKLIETDLDDLKDSFRDVERSAEDSADGVERAFEDSGDDIERAFDGIGREAQSEFNKVERAGRDASRGAGEGFRGLKDEANQSARETFASFDGSFEGIAELAQEVVANVSGSFKGITAAAAGFAGAAGIGLVLAAYDKWNERQEAIKESAKDFLGIYREAAGAINEASDALLAQNVIEEASAEQSRILAELAAGRGQTLQEYVLGALQGEYSTTEALAEVEGRRREIADEILNLSRDNSAQSQQQISNLQAEDAALQRQSENLRDIGSFLGDNKKARDAAVAAARAENAATESAIQAEERKGNRIELGRRGLEQQADAAGRTREETDRTKPKDFSRQVSDMERGAAAAERARDAWNSISDQTVTLTVIERTQRYGGSGRAVMEGGRPG